MTVHLHIVLTSDKGVFVGAYATQEQAEEVISRMDFPERYHVAHWYLETAAAVEV